MTIANEDGKYSSWDGANLLDNEFLPAQKEIPVSGKEFVSTTVTYHRLKYVIPTKVNRKSVDKVIINDCSGIMRPGLNAILGPTGSGKTSLLDILAARKDKRYLTGNVMINDEPQPDDFRLMSGFVLQDDTVWGTLSVRENLLFSASLRLSKRYSQADRETRVNTIIEDLGLTNCSETKVGTDEFRGVSGGERKRTAIGMELITNPDVLFLDEPTTGLDSTTAVTVVKLLQRQARQKRTVIFSIHQPRYSIFKLFDHITLLSRGQIVYAGLREEALGYFERLGYKCEMYNNPADHFMDVITSAEKLIGKPGDNDDNKETASSSFLSVHYCNSELFKDVYQEADNCMIEVLQRQHVKIDEKRKLNYQSSFVRQFGVLCRRTALTIFRDPRGIFSQSFVNVLMSIVVGAIYFNLDLGPGGLQNRVGVMFFLLNNMMFGNLSAIAVFLEQRRIFRHETANGYYRVSSYFLAKLICDIIPMRIVPVTLLAAIVYFMVGLQIQVDKFFVFYLTLIMTTLPAAGLCIFVSSSVNSFPVANILVTLPFVFTMLFSGFLVRYSDIPVWLHWLKYLSIIKYGLANLQINELRGLVFRGCGSYANETCVSGDEFLATQDIVADQEQIWINMGALGAMTFILLFLTYVQLRRIKRYT